MAKGYGVFTNNAFRRIWLGGIVTSLGDRIHTFSLAWLITDLTGSASALGGLLILWSLPNLVFTMAGGLLADRFSRKSIMIWSDLVRATLACGFSVVVARGDFDVRLAYGLAFLFGCFNALYVPAQNSLLPHVVDRDDLKQANSVVALSQQLVGIAGPLAAGILLGSGMRALPFLINSLSFFGPVWALWGLVVPEARPPHPRRSIWKDAVEGLGATWNDKGLIILFSLLAFFNLGIFGPYVVGTPKLVQTILGNQPGSLSVLQGAAGAGMILGGLWMTFGGGRIGRYTMPAPLFLVVGGLPFAALAISRQVLVSATLLVIVGVAVTMFNTNVMTTIQLRTPKERLGRVMGLMTLMVAGMDPLSFAAAGATADYLGAPWPFVFGGSLTALAGLLSLGLARVMSADPRSQPEPLNS